MYDFVFYCLLLYDSNGVFGGGIGSRGFIYCELKFLFMYFLVYNICLL